MCGYEGRDERRGGGDNYVRVVAGSFRKKGRRGEDARQTGKEDARMVRRKETKEVRNPPMVLVLLMKDIYWEWRTWRMCERSTSVFYNFCFSSVN